MALGALGVGIPGSAHGHLGACCTRLWDIPGMWHYSPELNREIWADDAAHPMDSLHWPLGVPESACGQKWHTLERNDRTACQLPSPSGHGAPIAGLTGPLAQFLRGDRPPMATAEEGRRVRLDDLAMARV